jgi:elongation factor G
MKLEVTTPEEHLGDVIGDLSSRRGHVIEIDSSPDVVRLLANVPLAEIFGYATALRSLTRGRAVFVAELSHFADVPDAIQQEVLSNRK